MLGVRIAAGMIVGAFVGLLLAPLMDALGASDLLKETASQTLQEIVSWGAGVFAAVALGRAERVEAFLTSHLVPASIGLGILVAGILQISSGQDMSVSMLLLAALNIALVAVFISFCGSFVYQGMFEVADEQVEQHHARRDTEVRRLQAESVALGDPGLASAYVSLHKAGAVSAAIGAVFSLVIGTIFFTAAFFALAIADARLLYGLSWAEAFVCAFLAAFGAVGLVGIALRTGAGLAPQISLDRKYKQVLPDPDDH